MQPAPEQRVAYLLQLYISTTKIYTLVWNEDIDI